MKNILCALVIHTKLSFPSAPSPSFSAPFGAGEGFYQAWGAVVSVQGRLWFMLRMLQHCGGEIHDPTLHPISAGAASGDPTAALGGDVEWGEQEIEAPRRDQSELNAAVLELCTCVTSPPC